MSSEEIVNKIPESLADLSRSQLRKLAKSYKIKVSQEMKRKDLRKLILNKMKNETLKPRTKEELVVDFIKSMYEIDKAIEPYKEQRKELKKEYKENNWLDSKEQRRAIKAFRLLKDRENIKTLVEYYNELSERTGLGQEEENNNE